MSKNLRRAILILSSFAIVIFLIFGLIGLNSDLGIPGLIQCVIVIMVVYCSLSTVTRFLLLPKENNQELQQKQTKQ